MTRQFQKLWSRSVGARVTAWASVAVCLVTFGLSCPLTAHAAEPTHGLSAFGELKYPADFSGFEYVNVNAPKGGRLSMIGPAGRTTFDSFNDFILKGDSAQGLGFIFDTLMTRAFDEADAVYGLIASSAQLADDQMSVTFQLRPEAKFADGTPVRARDVVYSFDILKTKGHPRFRIGLRDVIDAKALDELTVRYTFTGKLVRDLPLIVAALPVLSQAFYSKTNFEETTLTPPMGSGPYEIADFKPGTFVMYKRRVDYWGKDLTVNRGKFNFDELRYEYFRDRTSELHSLLSGSYDLREEFTSVDWATAYNVAPVKDGRLVRRTLRDDSPSGAQGFFINVRREKFKDLRVREALGLAFDFEWSNNNLFYGLYKRTASFFENSDMKASGIPTSAELALLEPFRGSLPDTVFGEAYSLPKSDASGSDRKLLRKAAKLLDDAGWKIKGTTRVNERGEALTIEILTFSQAFERVIGPYVKNLKLLGINASMRLIDPSQYQRRLKSFDFDLTTQRYSLRLTPGVEMRNYWGSQNANTDGGFNLAGIKDPVVDALIERALAAGSREDLVTATRALDRVLRAGHYWVPHWYKAAHNIAYWDKFGFPKTKPKFDRGIVTTWWLDAAKAAKLNPKQN